MSEGITDIEESQIQTNYDKGISWCPISPKGI